jgi:hypothetical protein
LVVSVEHILVVSNLVNNHATALSLYLPLVLWFQTATEESSFARSLHSTCEITERIRGKIVEMEGCNSTVPIFVAVSDINNHSMPIYSRDIFRNSVFD